jgi:hypothetical protein
VFSGQLLQDLVGKGMPRDDATRRCNRMPCSVGKRKQVFERVTKDERITKYMTPKDLNLLSI